jgi:hypothetical protein
MIWSTSKAPPVSSRMRRPPPGASSHATRLAPGHTRTFGRSSRGASQGSSFSRPSAQKRWRIASCAAAGRRRNQPGVFALARIIASTHDQSDAAKRGGGWRCATCTAAAPCSAISAAHS